MLNKNPQNDELLISRQQEKHLNNIAKQIIQELSKKKQYIVTSESEDLETSFLTPYRQLHNCTLHNVPGIYCIRNVETNTLYIGQSLTLKSRMNVYLYRLALETGTQRAKKNPINSKLKSGCLPFINKNIPLKKGVERIALYAWPTNIPEETCLKEMLYLESVLIAAFQSAGISYNINRLAPKELTHVQLNNVELILRPQLRDKEQRVLQIWGLLLPTLNAHHDQLRLTVSILEA